MLIMEYEKYNKLLIAELEETMGYAYSKGWESKRYDEGKQMRNKIQTLKGEING